MENFLISDPLFRQAVAAIDAGDVNTLKSLLTAHPGLLHDRLKTSWEGYFKDPYLLWFVAGNPVRHPKLADNIILITSTIIEALKEEKVNTLQEQLDYTLALVCSGRIPRESGVQLALIDLLITAGAHPESGYAPAAAHQEIAALEQLLKNGGRSDLLVAIATGRVEQANQLIALAGKEELQQGLAMAAFYGNAALLATCIKEGADVQAFCPPGLHDHSTPLHQAIWSGNLAAVKVLVEAGADLHIKDRAYFGTPFAWAVHGEQTDGSKEKAAEYAAISSYMREFLGRQIANDLSQAGLLSKEHTEQAVPIIAKKLGI